MAAVEFINAGGLLVAVIGIFLMLLQLVLLRRQLKLNALIKIMDSNREIVALGFDHSATWQTMEESDETPLCEQALTQRRYLQLWMNHMQIMWSAWQLGLVSAAEWESYRLDIAEFLQVKALQEHWVKFRRFYPKGFRKMVEHLRQAKGPATPESIS